MSLIKCLRVWVAPHSIEYYSFHLHYARQTRSIICHQASVLHRREWMTWRRRFCIIDGTSERTINRFSPESDLRFAEWILLTHLDLISIERSHLPLPLLLSVRLFWTCPGPQTDSPVAGLQLADNDEEGANTNTEIEFIRTWRISVRTSVSHHVSSGQTDRLNITYDEKYLFRFVISLWLSYPIMYAYRSNCHSILNPLWGYHLTKRLSARSKPTPTKGSTDA